MLRLGENLAQGENHSGEVQSVWKTGFCCSSRWAECRQRRSLTQPLLQEHTAQVQLLSSREQQHVAAWHAAAPSHSPRGEGSALSPWRPSTLCKYWQDFLSSREMHICSCKAAASAPGGSGRLGEPSRRPAQEARRRARVAFLHEPGCQLELLACKCFVHPK